jgi:hypothetical protein
MVRLQKERSKEFLETLKREVWLMSLSSDIAIKFAEEHFVDRPEKALDPAAALGFPWSRKHQPYLKIDGHLFHVLRGEIRTVVRIKNFWNAADMPMRMPLPPDTLSESEAVLVEEGGSKPR